jgi:hypothetical protein
MRKNWSCDNIRPACCHHVQGTKAGGFEHRPPLSSKSRVHLLIYTPHALKSLKSDINLILIKLKYLDRDTSALFNLYLERNADSFRLTYVHFKM